MLVSDPSFPLPLSFILLLPPAAVTPGLFCRCGQDVPSFRQVSLAWMKKRELVTITHTVSIKMATNFFHGDVA